MVEGHRVPRRSVPVQDRIGADGEHVIGAAAPKRSECDVGGQRRGSEVPPKVRAPARVRPAQRRAAQKSPLESIIEAGALRGRRPVARFGAVRGRIAAVPGTPGHIEGAGWQAGQTGPVIETFRSAIRAAQLCAVALFGAIDGSITTASDAARQIEGAVGLASETGRAVIAKVFATRATEIGAFA